MKKYNNPELEIIELEVNDIITTSLGTETTPKDEGDGIWDLDIGQLKARSIQVNIKRSRATKCGSALRNMNRLACG